MSSFPCRGMLALVLVCLCFRAYVSTDVKQVYSALPWKQIQNEIQEAETDIRKAKDELRKYRVYDFRPVQKLLEEYRPDNMNPCTIFKNSSGYVIIKNCTITNMGQGNETSMEGAHKIKALSVSKQRRHFSPVYDFEPKLINKAEHRSKKEIPQDNQDSLCLVFDELSVEMYTPKDEHFWKYITNLSKEETLSENMYFDPEVLSIDKIFFEVVNTEPQKPSFFGMDPDNDDVLVIIVILLIGASVLVIVGTIWNVNGKREKQDC